MGRSGGLPLDDALRMTKAIGWRRWGMLVLYYRAGLSQNQIARVFGVRRQMISFELRRAFEVVRRRMSLERTEERECRRRKPRTGEWHP